MIRQVCVHCNVVVCRSLSWNVPCKICGDPGPFVAHWLTQEELKQMEENFQVLSFLKGIVKHK
jgi:hypothetical protein